MIAVTDWLLVKSDADQRIEWRYAQRSDGVRVYGVEVQIEEQK